MHVIELNEDMVERKTCILQNNNDDSLKYISNPHNKILENVLVPNFSKSRADITVRWILSRYS
jgi:hypothetical protein